MKTRIEMNPYTLIDFLTIALLKEHEKRCWTVQFNNVDPHLMASGSDDAKVYPLPFISFFIAIFR
jgi:hypothetical protein